MLTAVLAAVLAVGAVSADEPITQEPQTVGPVKVAGAVPHRPSSNLQPCPSQVLVHLAGDHPDAWDIEGHYYTLDDAAAAAELIVTRGYWRKPDLDSLTVRLVRREQIDDVRAFPCAGWWVTLPPY